tara:strand:- start:1840 stop:2286 length:447 start_codon:yes stop_codon:yes gene_type:complete
MENYEVGQILYMTSTKSFKIIPIQVVEEVTRTTIEGTETTYMVCFPDEKKTIVDIKKVSGKTFKNISDVENHLIENTKKAIKELVFEANSLKDKVFGSSRSKNKDIINTKNIENVQQNDDDVIIKIDLGNGQKGRLSKKDLEKTTSEE